MLLAEEFALVAINPKTGRHALGMRSQVNACLAGLLLGELALAGVVAPGTPKATLVPVEAVPPAEPLLAAAADVVRERGPKIKAVLSHMDRGLGKRLDTGTWDSIVDALAGRGFIVVRTSGSHHRLTVPGEDLRFEIVERLRAAAAGDDPLDPRTALLLSMTGPGHLLEVVSPNRAGRKHARRRIDDALDDIELRAVGDTVRAILAEAAAVIAATAATTAVVASTS
jgi:Golgi phosphoprotein 3 (GPP34)